MSLPPPELIDDIIRDILLRLPPDEPAHLVRASLVCKSWCRLLTDPAFLRRYRAFHRNPPLLCFFTNLYYSPYTIKSWQRTMLDVPTASFRPRGAQRGPCHVLDCHHGRVLLDDYTSQDFIIWDPITGEDQRFPRHSRLELMTRRSAAVLCAAVDCDHLDCHGGPFLVVLVASFSIYRRSDGTVDRFTIASVYSSDTGGWSTPATIEDCNLFRGCPPIHAGDKIYFICNLDNRILRYDLHDEQSFSMLDIGGGWSATLSDIPMQAEHGGRRPRFAVLNGLNLNLWSIEVDSDGIAVWSNNDDIVRLDKLLSISRSADTQNWNLIGSTETPDSDIVFVSTDAGVFSVELHSQKIRKVHGENLGRCIVFPYRSFVTPDCIVGRLSLPLQQLG